MIHQYKKKSETFIPSFILICMSVYLTINNKIIHVNILFKKKKLISSVSHSSTHCIDIRKFVSRQFEFKHLFPNQVPKEGIHLRLLLVPAIV